MTCLQTYHKCPAGSKYINPWDSTLNSALWGLCFASVSFASVFALLLSWSQGMGISDEEYWPLPQWEGTEAATGLNTGCRKDKGLARFPFQNLSEM